jgi:integrase-like protein
MTENQDVHTKNWLPFEKAREYAQSLTLNKRDDWFNFCKERKLPDNIPRNPDYVYKKNWKSWGNWLGTGRISPADRNFRPFQKARMFIHSLKLKNKQEWNSYSKSESRPIDIPANPPRTYAKEWKGWGDWLGTGIIATWKREYLPFEKAREFVRSLNLQSDEDWRDYVKSGKKPDSIPAAPWNTYKKDWMGIFDWLG